MSKTNKKTRTVGRQSAQTGTYHVIQHVEQHWAIKLLGGLVRLRAELTTLVVGLIVWRMLDVYVWQDSYVWPAQGAWLLLAGLALALLVIPHTRRYVRSRVWCVLDRHRLRTCLLECGVLTYSGRLPVLLWARPTNVGEQVWLWLRPGLCGEDLERNTPKISTACLAREVRIHVHQRWTVLARVDIVRHDPLATAGVQSDLTADLPEERPGGQVIPLPDRTTVRPAQSPEHTAAPGDTGTAGSTTASTHPSTEVPRPRGTSRTRTRSADTAATAADPPVSTGVSGEDVTDYV